MINTNEIILKYYNENSELYQILISHSELVKQKALDISRKHPELQLDNIFVSEACMLHDIGILYCYAPSIHCYGSRQYIEHGYLGADLLRKEGLAKHALVCERHTGVGLSLQSVIQRNLPLPHRNYIPESIEEQVICYADKFYSKSKKDLPHDIDHILSHLKKHSPDYPSIFMNWHDKFS